LIAAWAQDITVGPVTVDTGDPWLDLLHVVLGLAALLVFLVALDRLRRLK